MRRSRGRHNRLIRVLFAAKTTIAVSHHPRKLEANTSKSSIWILIISMLRLLIWTLIKRSRKCAVSKMRESQSFSAKRKFLMKVASHRLDSERRKKLIKRRICRLWIRRTSKFATKCNLCRCKNPIKSIWWTQKSWKREKTKWRLMMLWIGLCRTLRCAGNLSRSPWPRIQIATRNPSNTTRISGLSAITSHLLLICSHRNAVCRVTRANKSFSKARFILSRIRLRKVNDSLRIITTWPLKPLR